MNKNMPPPEVLEEWKQTLPKEVFDKLEAELPRMQTSAWGVSLLLGELRDIAKGIGPYPEIAKDLFKPGGLRRFAKFIWWRIRFSRLTPRRYRYWAITIARPKPPKPQPRGA